MKYEQQAIVGLAEPTEVSAAQDGRLRRPNLATFISDKLCLQQKQFAELAGVSPATVNKWLFTDTEPNPHTVRCIAHDFGLTQKEAEDLFKVVPLWT